MSKKSDALAKIPEEQSVQGETFDTIEAAQVRVNELVTCCNSLEAALKEATSNLYSEGGEETWQDIAAKLRAENEVLQKSRDAAPASSDDVAAAVDHLNQAIAHSGAAGSSILSNNASEVRRSIYAALALLA